MSALIATFLGAGYLRPAPGTWGSLAALPVAWALMALGGGWLLLAGTALVIFGGLWAIRSEIAESGDTDPGHVVIDEVAGQWIALLPVAFGAAWAGVGSEQLWPGWIAAFLLFRLFDIWKPGPVGRADARGDAVGVMLDDVIAGAMAAVATGVLAVAGHALMRLL